jgi:hypothetical protein
MAEKVYIGIDIGDKTLTMDAVIDNNDLPISVTLPGGKFHGSEDILVTSVGYLTVKAAGSKDALDRTILVDSISTYKPVELKYILSNFKARPTTDTTRYETYKTATRLMMNKVFASPQLVSAIHTYVQNGAAPVYCFGYPTNWSKKDVAMMREVIDGVNLPVPGEIIFERESVAALVTLGSDLASGLSVNKNDCVLMLDFGSSTLNVTAVNLSSDNPLYNSGDNWFGGRLLDCSILNKFLAKCSDSDREKIQACNRSNNNMATSILLMDACSLKEKYSIIKEGKDRKSVV